MICPYCGIGYHDVPEYIPIDADVDGGWVVVKRLCPECKRLSLHLANGKPDYAADIAETYVGLDEHFEIKTTMVKPKESSYPPCPVEVPKKFAEDYNEAYLVLSDSPKASAALSRRCLQNILREVEKVNPGKLADEIQQVIDKKTLPPYLTKQIDAVRNIGNFAAHPIKSEKSHEIVPVESGEAEWNLDILEALFQFYFVQPTIIEKKRKSLDKKLKAAGKKPMK